jgi:pimeloyl-ACP methyl ester carboxylesterase
MTGQMMDQYAKEVEDFSFVPIRTYHKPRKIDKEYRRLRVAIGISGWLTEKDEVVDPWKVIGTGMEGFALRFELEALLNLGNSLTTMIRSAAWGYAKSEIIRRTVFASLTAALWPLGLLKVSRIIDNPFSVAKSRADKAGEVLADALINRAQGERPVTLIGYSLGARVIYTCLKSLAARKAFGLVESVVLLGAPAPSDAADWRLIRTVVTGRVVNVYSTSDYILGFLYRSSSVQLGIAGLQPVSSVPGIQNVDITELVGGNHTSYRYICGRVLRKIGFEDVDLAAVEAEEEALARAAASEESDRKANEQKAGDHKDHDAEVKELEGKVQEKNEASMMDWATERLKGGGASASSAASQARNWVQNPSPNNDGKSSKDVGGMAGGAASSLI